MHDNTTSSIKNITACKLKAGILYYTLFVALVMLLVVGLFIMIFYQESFFIANLKRSERINTYFSSALTLALANPSSNDYTRSLMLYENDPESNAIIAQQNWGLYNVVTVSLPDVPKSSAKSYLIGVTPNDTIRNTGLYLRDNFSYLSISGSTMLTGRTYLPYSGIASSSIEGVGYTGDSLVYGKKMRSLETLPAPFSDRLTRLFEKIPEIKGEAISESKPTSGSFAKRVRVLNSGPLLSGCHLCENVIIRSAGKLTIGRRAHLKNVIVYAPRVFVEAGFKGSCQIFATDTVIIQQNATLNYPSGVAVLAKNSGYLQVDSSARIYGYAIVKSDDNAHIRLLVRPTATLFGYVFCNAKVNHQGTIFGSLYAYGFEFRTGWGLYTSSLLNAKVLGNELSPFYVFPYVAHGRKTVICHLP